MFLTAATWRLLQVFIIIGFTYAAILPNEEETLIRDRGGEGQGIHAAKNDSAARNKKMIYFKGTAYFMGVNDDKYVYNGEHPIRLEHVKDFWIDSSPVTNREFDEFVRTTQFFRTDPEEKGYSYVFFSHMVRTAHIVNSAVRHLEPWWLPVKHARWSIPFGPGSSWKHLLNYPVVHVGLADADAYCRWLGKRLPNEYEWEYAARGNNESWFYPWGDHFRRNRMNLWQGIFPAEDEAWDGYAGMSPVDAYQPQNALGMYDMLGNVWEWTNTEYYGNDKPKNDTWFILRGGSYVDSYDGEVNHIVRVASKIGRPLDFSAENVGFRCVKPVPVPPPTPKPARVFRLQDSWHFKQQQRKLREKFARLQEKQRILHNEVKKRTIDHPDTGIKDEL